MKLIIQIPCYNEEKTLPQTLADLPSKLEGIDKIEILIIDDGSTDNTLKVAKEHGVDHVIRFNKHAGLARAFKTGIEEALRLKADIIVNTDADNQYQASEIPKLIKPILEKKADIVIGNRQILKTHSQGLIKGILQFAGSLVVSRLSGLKLGDVTSGFRAFSRQAAVTLNIVSDFSYTLESIIQAGKKGLSVVEVPIKTNKVLRKSRLFKNNFHYIQRSIATIIRVYVAYEGFRIFVMSGTVFISLGIFLILRYAYFYFANLNPSGHMQSLIAAAILIVVGFLIVVLGLLVDLVCGTRRIAEESLTRLKELKNVKIDK